MYRDQIKFNKNGSQKNLLNLRQTGEYNMQSPYIKVDDILHKVNSL